MRFFTCTTLLFIYFSLCAQVGISFERLDFSKNTYGDVTAFVFRADTSILTRASPDTNKVSLSQTSNCDLGAWWKINVQMNLNPSNSNSIKFYILSDSENLAKATNAYYIVMGNNADEVSLYSQTASSSTKVIDGTDKRLDKDTVRVEVVVSLDKAGKFTLWSKRRDEDMYYQEGTAQIKQNYVGTSHLGFLCTYSSKNTNKFIIQEIAIHCPKKEENEEGENPAPPTIEDENFSLSARSFYLGGEPVYLQYKFPEAGYIARIITFDGTGNKIAELANNSTLAQEGRFELTGNYPPGIIIIYAEARKKNGEIIQKKIPIICGK
jgi:hypothetical protein